VILPDGSSIGGLRVSVGEQRQVTASDGGFELREVPASYDLTIAEHGGRFITAYFGLTRRDPILTHTARAGAEPAGAAHHADIEGIVDASPLVGAARAQPPGIYFLSPSTFAKGSVVEYRQDRGKYRVSVDWAAPGPVNGILLAVASVDGQAYLAKRRLKITDGEDTHAALGDDQAGPDLRFGPVALGQIGVSALTFMHEIEFTEGEAPVYSKPGGGWVTTRPGSKPDRETIRAGYAVPGTVGLVDLGECEMKDRAFVCRVPDLSMLGGEYCIRVASIVESELSRRSPGPGSKVDLRANRCGAKLGSRDFHIERASPPDIAFGNLNFGPDTSEAFTKDRLSWSASGETLYQLSIGSCNRGGCLVAYLSKTAFTWADFETTGMTYLRGGHLAARVSAFYPPMTVDALASVPRPLGDRSTWQRADSRAAVIGLKDPPSSSKAPDVLARRKAPLPTCPAAMEVHSTASLDTGMDGTEISLRGRLVWQETECVEYGCNAIWVLDPLGSQGRRVGLLERMSPVPGMYQSASGIDKGISGIEVVATGTLVARAPRSQYDDEARDAYSLNDVVVCVVRPAAAR
jgi:hypothetical protein